MGRVPSNLIFLVEKVYRTSRQEAHPELGSHWVVSSHLAFWTTGDSLIPGGFLLMALVQMVPVMVPSHAFASLMGF